MIFHHLGKSCGPLVVRGVRLVNESRMFRQGGRKCRRFLPVVIENYVFAELHSGLHDHANYSFPRWRHSMLVEGRAEEFQGVMNLVGRGHCGRSSRERLAAGGGNLGADYVKER